MWPIQVTIGGNTPQVFSWKVIYRKGKRANAGLAYRPALHIKYTSYIFCLLFNGYLYSYGANCDNII